jgi:hypothetical protein
MYCFSAQLYKYAWHNCPETTLIRVSKWYISVAFFNFFAKITLSPFENLFDPKNDKKNGKISNSALQKNATRFCDVLWRFQLFRC